MICGATDLLPEEIADLSKGLKSANELYAREKDLVY
jgi:hypothetical protein